MRRGMAGEAGLSLGKELPLTLGRHGFELSGSTYMWGFLNKCCIFPFDFLNNTFFSPAYCIVRIQYTIHITYKIPVDCLLSVRLRSTVGYC